VPINRPALRYYGGKWKIAPWVISHFPAHINYVEPCGGAASVLLQKPVSPLETFNDIDGRVVNFFRVLRECPDELIRQIRLTPWSRAEFEGARQAAADPVEMARRWFVLCWQSISKPGGSWRVMYDYSARSRSAPMDGVEIDHLYQVAERLKLVQVECRDALQVIELYDGPEALIYFDPPYLKSTRASSNKYAHEVDDAFHREAAALLRVAKGYVVVSGYASPLYAEIYEAYGWVRRDSRSVATNGSKRVESVWLSPRTWQALSKFQLAFYEETNQ
jgi:DNA adenine methylase